jgi:hypothetical protein
MTSELPPTRLARLRPVAPAVVVVVILALLYGACQHRDDDRAGPAGTDRPRSDLVNVTLPQGSTLIESLPGIEAWRVPELHAQLARDIGSQLPIEAAYGDFRWCKSIVDLHAGLTKWLWGASPDDMIVITASDAELDIARGPLRIAVAQGQATDGDAQCH